MPEPQDKQEKKRKEIKEYDFRQPEQVGKEQVDALKAMCESTFQKMANSLANQFGTSVQSQLISADQMVYREFIRTLQAPTIIGLIDMSPLNGMSLLEIEPNLVFNFIDRLLGGRGEMIALSRGLTDIEYKIVEGMLLGLIAALKSSWASMIALEPKLVRVENNPQFAQIAGPTNMVVAGVSELRVGEASGNLRYCIPLLTVESIMDRLGGQGGVAVKEVSKEDALKMKGLVDVLDIPLIAELGRSAVTLKDLLRLQVGDVMRLNNRATEDLLLRVGESPKFSGRPGVVGMRMAIQVSQVIG